MKKLAVLTAIVFVCASVCAQPAKKVRHTASNTKEAVTERQISGRFNKGLRAYYTAQYEDSSNNNWLCFTAESDNASFFYMSSPDIILPMLNNK